MIHTGPFMEAVFAAAPVEIRDETKQVALSTQAAIDQVAIQTGLLSWEMASHLAAKIAVQLQLEDRIKPFPPPREEHPHGR